MKEPIFPKNEIKRQKELEKYELLDTLPEESYDTITSLMSYTCDVPISLVAILDKQRNFLKSHHGVPFDEDPRERSFCGHAILYDDDIMIVADALKDERFHDNPLVVEMGVRFYAGAPLVNPNGYKIGTLCVFDTEPKELNQYQIEALINMSKQVMLIMEQRYSNIQLQKVQNQLIQRNQSLEKFASVISHDIKSPLLNITSLTDILSKTLIGKVDEESERYIGLIGASSESLADYINGILKYHKSEELFDKNIEQTTIEAFFSRIENIFSTEQDLKLNLISNLNVLEINIAAINQILINLITNGSKYNSKEKRRIDVRIKEEIDNYKFEVEDNGDGMTLAEKEKIFVLFETNDKIDRLGKKGTGIGLSTVKKLIENLKGKIWIESTIQVGTLVHITIPKG